MFSVLVDDNKAKMYVFIAQKALTVISESINFLGEGGEGGMPPDPPN